MEKIGEQKMSIIIFVFGDSIAYGEADYEMGGWANRLKIFHRARRGKFNHLYNFSVSGSNTKDFLNIINEIPPRLSKSPRKYLAIFSLSVNDGVYSAQADDWVISGEQLEKAINEIVKKIKKFTDNFVFISPVKVDEKELNPIPWNSDKFYKNKKIKECCEIAKEFCQANNHHFVDIYDLLTKDDFDDGLHPNSIGHEKIFRKVKDYLINNKLI